MKIRNGFVSNSSSSSFVVGKNFLTDDQIVEFRNNLEEINENNFGEGDISESKHYFQGNVSLHNTYIEKVIERLGIEEYCSFDC